MEMSKKCLKMSKKYSEMKFRLYNEKQVFIKYKYVQYIDEILKSKNLIILLKKSKNQKKFNRRLKKIIRVNFYFQ